MCPSLAVPVVVSRPPGVRYGKLLVMLPDDSAIETPMHNTEGLGQPNGCANLLN
jgi:hypothetical protein